MMRPIVGVTGGIATGKTTATQYLQTTYGCVVLDADQLARQAVLPGSEALDLIVRRYGLTMLQPDGTLDRARLGRLVFEQPRERQWLEGVIHPWVRDRFQRGIQEWRDHDDHTPQYPQLILSIPLLFEANLEYLVDTIWVIACSPEMQLQRLMERDRLPYTEAQQRISAQLPIREKCDRSDRVIHNNGSIEHLHQEIDQVWLSR